MSVIQILYNTIQYNTIQYNTNTEDNLWLPEEPLDGSDLVRSVAAGHELHVEAGAAEVQQAEDPGGHDGLTALEKQEKIRDAMNKLETILYNSTRKGLKPKLAKLKRE